MAARKGRFVAPPCRAGASISRSSAPARAELVDLEAINAEYERYIAFHNLAHEESQRDAAARAEWVKKVEAAWEERTAWALEIQKARDEAVAEFRRVSQSEAEAWQAVDTLSRNLERTQADLARLSESKWTRLGRKLRILNSV